MKLLPNTKEGRLRLDLFPFKVYIVAVPITILAGMLVQALRVGGTFEDLVEKLFSYECIQIFKILSLGYVVCILAFIIIGHSVADTYIRKRKAVISLMIWAALALLFLAITFLLTAPTK